MIDINLNRLQEITIILYGLSVLFYFIDFLQNNRKAHKAAFWFLSIVWLMQTIFLCLYMFEVGRFPVLTLFEGLYFYVWILITFSLILNRIIRTDFFMFFTKFFSEFLSTCTNCVSAVFSHNLQCFLPPFRPKDRVLTKYINFFSLHIKTYML